MKKLEISIFCNFAISCCLALAGCGTTPAPATQRVDVPVPVSCVKPEDVPQRPDYAVERLAPTASDGEKGLGSCQRLATRSEV